VRKKIEEEERRWSEGKKGD